MTIEEFWNAAFLAALCRLPAEEAVEEANRATELCIEHWKDANKRFVSPRAIPWKDHRIASEKY